MSDNALPTETVKSGAALLKRYHAADIPVWLEGPPGVGKSAMAKQVADELGIGFIDVRLSQMDPVDLRGLPTAEKGITSWARPDFWPDVKRDGEKGIILFDELSDAGRAMQSAAYQVILDRRAGPHKIPDGWYPMAAGNRREDKAAAQQISSALATRFAWLSIRADADAFREWGHKAGIHPFVLGYLKFRPGHIWTKEGANSNTFACPRQWERVSKVCDAPAEERYRLVVGLVGHGVGGEFESTIKTFDLPSLEEIIKDPKKCRIPTKPAEKYAVAAMLSQGSTTKNFDKIQEYCKRDAFGRDFWICMTIDATHRDASLCDTPAFTQFANENAKLKL